jgi:hypothetical protein
MRPSVSRPYGIWISPGAMGRAQSDKRLAGRPAPGRRTSLESSEGAFDSDKAVNPKAQSAAAPGDSMGWGYSLPPECQRRATAA